MYLVHVHLSGCSYPLTPISNSCYGKANWVTSLMTFYWNDTATWQCKFRFVYFLSVLSAPPCLLWPLQAAQRAQICCRLFQRWVGLAKAIKSVIRCSIGVASNASVAECLCALEKSVWHRSHRPHDSLHPRGAGAF